MTTSPIAGDSQIANALTTLGTTALGSTRNELLTQLIVAAANATGGGSGGAAWGDITGTLSAQTDLQAALDAKLALAGGTMTGALVNSTNGAASTPSLLLSGTPFTGGSATTTKPLVNIETAGATSTGWSTGGTMLGVNAPSGFAGNLADWQLNGTSVLKVSASSGRLDLNAYDSPHAGAGVYIGNGGTENVHLTANQGLNLSKSHVVGWVDAFNTSAAPTSGFTWSASAVTKFYNPSSGAGAGLEMVEMTAPAAAPANSGRLFLQDNGAGKTQLMIIFASGAAQQIAIEP